MTANNTGRVGRYNVNLRDEPTTQSALLRTYSAGTSLTFDAYTRGASYYSSDGSQDSTWLRINGTSDWVAAGYIDGENLSALSYWERGKLGNSSQIIDQVVQVTNAPLDNVQRYLPLVVNALKEFGIYNRLTLIATVATIATEVGAFAPINEYGDDDYFTRMYENRQDLGNTSPGDGARYHGRGFIQLTGRANYRNYGSQLGVDLENNPDLALDPTTSARILARYFVSRNINEAAQAEDWERVRRSVNGGLNGWERFIAVVNQAKQIITV